MTTTPLFPPAPIAGSGSAQIMRAAELELSFRRAMPAPAYPQPHPAAPVRPDLLDQAPRVLSALKQAC